MQTQNNCDPKGSSTEAARLPASSMAAHAAWKPRWQAQATVKCLDVPKTHAILAAVSLEHCWLLAIHWHTGKTLMLSDDVLTAAHAAHSHRRCCTPVSQLWLPAVPGTITHLLSLLHRDILHRPLPLSSLIQASTSTRSALARAHCRRNEAPQATAGKAPACTRIKQPTASVHHHAHWRMCSTCLHGRAVGLDSGLAAEPVQLLSVVLSMLLQAGGHDGHAQIFGCAEAVPSVALI